MQQTEKSANSFTSFRSDIVLQAHDASMHRISQVLLGFGVRVDQGRTSQPRGPFRLLWGQEAWAQGGLTEAQTQRGLTEAQAAGSGDLDAGTGGSAAGSRDLDAGTGGLAAGSGDLDAGTRGFVLSWESSARSALSSGSSARAALSGGRRSGLRCPGGRWSGPRCHQKLKQLVVWRQLLLLQLMRLLTLPVPRQQRCHCGARVWRQRLGAQE